MVRLDVTRSAQCQLMKMGRWWFSFALLPLGSVDTYAPINIATLMSLITSTHRASIEVEHADSDTAHATLGKVEAYCCCAVVRQAQYVYLIPQMHWLAEGVHPFIMTNPPNPMNTFDGQLSAMTPLAPCRHHHPQRWSRRCG